MYRIRFYDKIFLPSQLKGRLGSAIKALNWVRWKMEVLVQRLMVSYLAKENALPDKEHKDILAIFKTDVLEERLSYARSALPTYTPEQPPRYSSGSIVSSMAAATEEGHGLVPATEMISRYMNPRTSKYAAGKRFTVVRDEADFEPVAEQAED